MTTKTPRVFSDLPIPPGENSGGRDRSPWHDPEGACGQTRPATSGSERDY